MTETEKIMRRALRKHLEDQVHDQLFDKHGNEVKALHLTQVMNLILNDLTITNIKYMISKEKY